MTSNAPTPDPEAIQLTADDIVVIPQATPSEPPTIYFELEIKQVEIDKLKLLNMELQQNIEGRGDWGTRVFWLLVGWLIAVLGVVFFEGFGYRGFHVDNSVVIAFIGTTTVDVLSLGYIVANYLFPKAK